MTPAERYYSSIKDDRNSWRESMPQRCMNCTRAPGVRSSIGETVLWLEVHEILSRAQAPNRWWFRANGLLLCHWCHPKVAGRSHAEQLAIKMRADPAHYDLREWLRRRNPNAMQYVTESEVQEHIKRRTA